MENIIEKWSGGIFELNIGSTKNDGGTRSNRIKIGSPSGTLPFLHFEGKISNPPAVAMEVWDIEPPEWPEVLRKEFGDTLKDPARWAKKCESFGCDLICLRLESANPDGKNAPGVEISGTIKNVLSATSLPLIIIGCGNNEKDSSIIMDVCQASAGENCLIGMATKENYKTFIAAAASCGHSLIAETPLDINLEKQLNILMSDMGFGLDRIVIHPTTGGLGYGFEYCYSIIERTRLAALSGDRLMAQPILTLPGQETWKVKEATAADDEKPEWGRIERRGILWEIATAVGYIISGSDIVVMNHPRGVKTVKEKISILMSAEGK